MNAARCIDSSAILDRNCNSTKRRLCLRAEAPLLVVLSIATGEADVRLHFWESNKKGRRLRSEAASGFIP